MVTELHTLNATLREQQKKIQKMGNMEIEDLQSEEKKQAGNGERVKNTADVPIFIQGHHQCFWVEVH